MSCCSRTN